MSQCHIKNKNQNISLWSIFTKNETGFKFSTSLSLCLLSSLVIIFLLYESSSVFSLMVSYDSVFPVSVSVSKKQLCSVFIEPHKTHQMGERTEKYYIEIFSKVLEGIKSLILTDPDNKQM